MSCPTESTSKRKAADMNEAAYITMDGKRYVRRRLKHPTSTGPPPQPPTKSHFLTLPPEIRNEIYRVALASPLPFSIGPSQALPAQPGILQTCRQIRAEAAGIYYALNTLGFWLDMDGSAQRWKAASALRGRCARVRLKRVHRDMANVFRRSRFLRRVMERVMATERGRALLI